jgi:cytochrome c oxidase subunit 2
MNQGVSNFCGAIFAWMCLAPVAFARESRSMSNILALASTPAHYFANLPLFGIWIAGGIFLVGGGLLAFAPFRSRTRKSDPLSGPAQAYQTAEIDLAWTVIPVLVLVLFLATTRINSAIENVSKPGAAVEVTAIGR